MKSLALDMDNVLADIVPRVRDWLVVYKGKSFKKEEWTDWGWPSREFKLTKSETVAMFEYVWHDWEIIMPTENHLTQKVNSLGSITRLFIVTATSPAQSEGKMKWLQREGLDWAPLVMVPFGSTKEGLGFDIYVDDRASTIEKAVELGRQAYVYDQPWNKGCMSGTRIETLDDVVSDLVSHGGRMT